MKKILLLLILFFTLQIFADQFHVSIKASTNKKKVNVGEYFTLKITIETIGSFSNGSYSMPNLPNMKWAVNVSTFNSSSSVAINNHMKTKFTISAKYKAKLAGKYIIPPVKFSYTDPNTDQTLNLDSEKIPMSVKKPGISFPMILILFIIIIIIIVIILAINNGKRNKGSDDKETDVNEEESTTKSRYENLRDIQDPQMKFKKFEDAFRGYLLEKYSITRNILRDKMKEIIAKKEINEEVKETLFDILDFIYLTKYKGLSTDTSEINKWIEKLENLSEK